MAVEASAGVVGGMAACERTVLYAATGSFVVRMADCGLGDAALGDWIAGDMVPQVELFIGANHTVRQADFDFSKNQITDAGLSLLLNAWLKTGVGCPVVLKLHFNRLTDDALDVLAGFVKAYRGELRELHLTNNAFCCHAAISKLLHSFVGLPQYPVWIRRQRRYTPVYLRLGSCGIVEPKALLQKSPHRLCLMADEGQCSKTLCCMAERGNAASCPVAHLYGFLNQESQPLEGREAEVTDELHRERGEVAHQDVESDSTCHNTFASPRAGLSPISSYSALQNPEQLQDCARVYLCGACGRSLPINQFGRHQLKKATQIDSGPLKDHLIRRCNDCVKQPCSACGKELALSQFGKSQLMRPHGQRRCKMCTVDTMMCVRCSKPKLRSEFSVVEARKRKTLPRICSDCEHINPYFERRYTVVLLFGGSHRIAPSGNGGRRVPSLPKEILQRIIAFSEPGDEFIQVFPREFTCNLCTRSWSLSTNYIERHMRAPEHQKRLAKVHDGLLIRINSLSLESSRFHYGLGIRGAVCSRESVREAQSLVHISGALAQGFTHEVLQVAGLPPGVEWIPPRIIELAQDLQLGTATPPEGSFNCAESRSAQRRWKLFGHAGSDLEGHDVDELNAVCAMLCTE